MLAQLTPQRAWPNGLNAHFPPFCRRVISFNKDEQKRSVWPRRRSHMEFDEDDYMQTEETEPELSRRIKKYYAAQICLFTFKCV